MTYIIKFTDVVSKSVAKVNGAGKRITTLRHQFGIYVKYQWYLTRIP